MGLVVLPVLDDGEVSPPGDVPALGVVSPPTPGVVVEPGSVSSVGPLGFAVVVVVEVLVEVEDVDVVSTVNASILSRASCRSFSRSAF